MIPELGLFSLILALCIATILTLLPLIGSIKQYTSWMNLAKPLAIGLFFFVFMAFMILICAFLSDDFSVDYVARHSNSLLPIYYKVSAVWGGHEGSLLLWILILSGWTAAVALKKHLFPYPLYVNALSVLGAISTGFLLFILFTSNPFIRLLPFPPTDGADLNPLLQDIGLIIHPPLLYMGYVGFSVAYALAVAVLIEGKPDTSWARILRPWTTAAWCFLTLGIALGSWWAYYELGWGGWWFWDPVENASLIPWLTGTALIHSLAITEKRGLFSSWTLLLAIFCFSLSLLGTFLVRSGILTSVHAFSNDPDRGIFILIYLLCVTGAALLLFALRIPNLHKITVFSWCSRETLLLLNNILLTVSAATVLFGTLFPLILETLDAGMISVGPPYFNQTFTPIALLLALSLGFGILLQWKKDNSLMLIRKSTALLILCVAGGMLLYLLFHDSLSTLSVISIMLALWIISTLFYDIFYRKRRASLMARLKIHRRSFYGMHMAHLGLAITIIGVSVSSTGSTQQDLRMAPGDTTTVNDYTFTFQGTKIKNGPNYVSDYSTFLVHKNNNTVARLHPEKRFFPVTGMIMTEAAIDTTPARDLYVALGEPLDEQKKSWAVRIYVKPFIAWIWAGAFLMAAGGALAVSDKRYRAKRKHLKTTKNTALELNGKCL
ncbi:Cytochrome c-type biogenesis protein CcmF [invertebrate metagenome]|uniref:Cytochrome c-type biogenesis protein CcmF n=1 Tax=invertebrate metagenome TaxID=1711999 RepID=A0A2H9T9Z4_9ZZZZ